MVVETAMRTYAFSDSTPLSDHRVCVLPALDYRAISWNAMMAPALARVVLYDGDGAALDDHADPLQLVDELTSHLWRHNPMQ